MNIFKSFSLLSLIFLFTSCSKNDAANTTTNSSTIVPAVYNKIYGATSITNDGTYITIKTKDLPDHKSPYYATDNVLYEAYIGTTFSGVAFQKNPNSIIEQSGTIKIPVNPKINVNFTKITVTLTIITVSSIRTVSRTISKFTS